MIAVAALAAAASMTMLAWLLWPRREPDLERDWAARVFVIAGDGIEGADDREAWRARFSEPFGVAVDGAGAIYVADAGQNHRIRRLTLDGPVTTIAGGEAGFADGFGAAAQFSTPSGLAVADDGTVYVADTGNNVIRRISRQGHVSTLAGDGTAGYRDGPGREARFNAPIGVAIDRRGRIIVADSYNDRIRAIAPDGTVSTLAGGAVPDAIDGAAADARFDTPSGVAIDASGNIYIADGGNGRLRMLSTAGVVSTITGPGADMLRRPVAVAIAADGARYVTDESGVVVEIARDGGGRLLAGSTNGFADGNAAEARFRRPAGVASLRPGHIIVADAGNALVRLIAAQSRIGPRPPSSPLIAPRFDADAFGWQPLLWPADPLEGPHEIAGTAGEARGGEGADRFHAGIDVRVEDGTPVLAVRSGVVASPWSTDGFGSLNESMRIGPIAYVHIRAGRSGADRPLDAARFVPTYDEQGKLVRIRVKRGARFTTGEVIGAVNRFNHVHLNVGWPGEEFNPLQFRLVRFQDTVEPAIAGVRLFDEAGQPLASRVQGRLVVSGRVQIVVDAWDQADGNRPDRRLGLYALGYQVINRDDSPVPGFEQPRPTLVFNRLTSDRDAPPIVYAPGSGIPFYGRRVTRFLYIVTNTFLDGVAREGAWDTSTLAPGDYTLRVWAEDARGNEATRDVAVRVIPRRPL